MESQPVQPNVFLQSFASCGKASPSVNCEDDTWSPNTLAIHEIVVDRGIFDTERSHYLHLHAIYDSHTLYAICVVTTQQHRQSYKLMLSLILYIVGIIRLDVLDRARKRRSCTPPAHQRHHLPNNQTLSSSLIKCSLWIGEDMCICRFARSNALPTCPACQLSFCLLSMCRPRLVDCLVVEVVGAQLHYLFYHSTLIWHTPSCLPRPWGSFILGSI